MFHLEQLEERKVLDVSYWGVYHSNTTSTEEDFYYQVSVDNAGTGEMWIRYNEQFNRIDFDDNQSFSNVSNSMGVIPSAYVTGNLNGVGEPFSLTAQTSVRQATWNDGTTKENFHSMGVDISAADGSKVYLANGNDFPLRLYVSSASWNSDSISSGGVREDAWTSGVPSLVDFRGPIDNTSRLASSTLSHGIGVGIDAADITVDAEITTTGVSADAQHSVEFKNTITGSVLSYIETGDFHLTAGATINGNTGIYIGTEGNATGRGGDGGDIKIDGELNASNLTMQTNSITQDTHIVSGTSGVISGGGSLNLFNAGLDGGTIDITTRNYSVTNVNVADSDDVLPDIGIDIEQTSGNLVIAAVPASRGQITLTASGNAASIDVNAGISTRAGLRLDASDLNVNSPLSTSAGNIQLVGNTVFVGSNVSAGTNGVGNIAIESRIGGVTLDSASVIDVDTGFITIDSAQSISSEATLTAELVDLQAAALITASSGSKRIRATAGAGINIVSEKNLDVEVATTNAGSININALGDLFVSSVNAKGGGDVTLTSGSGLIVEDARIANGDAEFNATTGDITINNEVTVQATTGGDLRVNAETGNIIIDTASTLSIADRIELSSPFGRVLTPGEIVGFQVIDNGSGYTTAPDVEIAAGSGATATPQLTSGGVASIRVTDGGSGYVTSPTVNILGGGGANARATSIIDQNGVVTEIRITNLGAGYTEAPTITFSGGSGSGAKADAFIDGVRSIAVNTIGKNYVIPPQVIVSSGEGATANAIAIDADGAITSINLGNPGGDYGVAPDVVITDSSGRGAGASAKANTEKGVTSTLITSGGSGYATNPIVTINAPGGGGEQAEARAIIEGSVAHIIFDPMTDGGGNYSSNVLTVFSENVAESAQAQATIHGQVLEDQWDIRNGGQFNFSTGNSPADVAPFERTSDVNTVRLTPQFGLGITAFTLTAGTETYNSALTWQGPIPEDGTNADRASGRILVDDNGKPESIEILFPGRGYTGAEDHTVAGYTIGNTGTNNVRQAGEQSTLENAKTHFEISDFDLSVVVGENDGFSQDLRATSFPIAGASPVATNIIFPVRGEILTVGLTDGGSGYTKAPEVTFFEPLASRIDGFDVTDASAQSMISASVTELIIVKTGFGYSSDPVITIGLEPSPAPGVTPEQATAETNLSSVVTDIEVINPGSDYNPATTTVSVNPISGGSGAVASAISATNDGEITSIHISTKGQDYVAPPTVEIRDSSGLGTGATAHALLEVGQVIVEDGGAGYTTATVEFAGPGVNAEAKATMNASGSLTTPPEVTNKGWGYTPNLDALAGDNENKVDFGAAPTASGATIADQTTNASGQLATPIDGVHITLAGDGYPANSTTVPVTFSNPSAFGLEETATSGAVTTENDGSITQFGNSRRYCCRQYRW